MEILRGAILILLLGLISQADAFSQAVQMMRPGDTVSCFRLKDTREEYFNLHQDTSVKGYIVVFTSNDCSFSKQYLNRIKKIHTKYSTLGFPVLAINIGDSIIRPGDSFSKMQELVQKRQLEFRYLLDSQQVVAEQFGIRTIPVVFLLKKHLMVDEEEDTAAIDFTIVYRGAIDDSPSNENLAENRFLADALDLILLGKDPQVAETSPVGCKIGDKRN